MTEEERRWPHLPESAAYSLFMCLSDEGHEMTPAQQIALNTVVNSLCKEAYERGKKDV